MRLIAGNSFQKKKSFQDEFALESALKSPVQSRTEIQGFISKELCLHNFYPLVFSKREAHDGFLSLPQPSGRLPGGNTVPGLHRVFC